MNVQSTQSESTPRRLTLSKNIILDEENSDFEDLDELPDLDDSFLDSKIEKPTSRNKSKLAISQDQFSSFETSVDLKTEILSETNNVQVDFGVQTTKFTLPWDDMFELQNYLQFCCGICEYKTRKGIEFRTHLGGLHVL